MEIGLEVGIPTYSGGLGLLAGDTIRAAADLKVPMVAVTLLYRKGYFHQKLDSAGRQNEEPVEWAVDDFLQELDQRTCLVIEGRIVWLRAWRYDVVGAGGFVVPVYFLDTDLPENDDWDRKLTHSLYGGDLWYRLCQEAVLGDGGLRMLSALGHEQIARFHMNEGHAAILTLALLDQEIRKTGRQQVTHDDIEAVREKCIFTTHTPVPAGHDQFPMDMVGRLFGSREHFFDMSDLFCVDLVGRILGQQRITFEPSDYYNAGNKLNMTYLALNLSRYVNGVAKKHGEVSRLMFADYAIDAITNGVHAATWVCKPFEELYDRYIPGWRQDNFSLRYALNIPREEIWQAHQQAKKYLLLIVNHETNAGMDADLLTIGFARRAATYKRADLIFHNLERLKRIAADKGAIQLLFAGKAHPRDEEGKALISRIFQFSEALGKEVRVAYIPNYNMELGRIMTAGVDVWLNTPQPPLEASGTSGMKAAVNGVPSLSVMDGWWIEGCIEGVTGWGIGDSLSRAKDEREWEKDATALYDKLEQAVIPLFYDNREAFINIMHHAIALNGSFFNTHRMMQQYVLKAYM